MQVRPQSRALMSTTVGAGRWHDALSRVEAFTLHGVIAPQVSGPDTLMASNCPPIAFGHRMVEPFVPPLFFPLPEPGLRPIVPAARSMARLSLIRAGRHDMGVTYAGRPDFSSLRMSFRA